MASQVATPPSMMIGTAAPPSPSPPPSPPPPLQFDGDDNSNEAMDEKKESKEDEEQPSPSSPCVRHALKQELALRSKALTKHEHGFLQKLADHGDRHAVRKARERLADESLFFDIRSSQRALAETTTSTKYEDPSSTSAQTESAVATANNNDRLSTTTSRTHSMRRASVGSESDMSGHERRMEYLENRRRNCQLHGQIWKAHESGMSLTRMQSAPVAATGRRHSSFTTSSLQAAAAAAAATTTSPIVPAKAGILRATSALSVSSPQERAEEEAKIFRSNFEKELLRAIPPPQSLGRGFSDGSRKSVTFNDIRQLRLFNRRASVDLPLPGISSGSGSSSSIPKPDSTRMTRSMSITEGIDLNAIMFGAATESSSNSLLDSSTNSLFDNNNNNVSLRDFPPIQHPKRLESFSSTTAPSIHLAHSVHSDAGSTTTNNSTSVVPPLRTAHPVRSDSLPESALSWDMSEDSFARGAKEAFRQKYSRGMQAASPSSAKSEPPAGFSETNKAPLVVMKPQVIRPSHMNGFDAGELASWQKPVLLRRASQTIDDGEGIEVTEWDTGSVASSSFRQDSLQQARLYSSMLSLADSTTAGGSIKTVSSYEEGPTYNRDDIFRIRKSFSDDEVANIFLGVSRKLLKDNSSMNTAEPRPEDDFDDMSSWMDSEYSNGGHFDSWNVLKDEYENGYGGGGTLPFRIVGTSSDDISSHPHVLSPPLMESLQNFLPWSLSESNFWMKYSMVRDGASLHSMLQHVRGSKYTILAVETMDGEVFGSFTTMPWRKNWNFFGTGESFLWRMRHSRQDKCHSIVDQAHMESEIDVYPWTQENNCFQLCTHNRIAVGCGSGAEVDNGSFGGDEFNDEDDDDNRDDPRDIKAHEWGFGLSLDSDLLTGVSSPCATFGNPSLSSVHADGSRFEIINLEVWTLTPCDTLDEALKLELGQLFLESN